LRSTLERNTKITPVKREAIRPPKFADKFSMLDWESMPLPAISLYPLPRRIALVEDLALQVSDLDCNPRSVSWPTEEQAPRVTMEAPLICQIFNWSEVVEWQGVRASDFLDYAGISCAEGDHVAFFSRDGTYFEGLPAAMARDPRTLLATHINGEPLPHEFGGPLRLVVPFLQGYKSVKWVGSIRVTKHDPVGIKRLLGQSKTAHLGLAWRQSYDIEVEPGADKTPV
jgi:DMSO/TMAO reductase YedYZ molybdopterin-dependent catalytic subunit